MITKYWECKCIVKVGQLIGHRHYPYGINQSICKVATTLHASSATVAIRRIYSIITVTFHLPLVSDTCFDKMSPTPWLAEKNTSESVSNWYYRLGYMKWSTSNSPLYSLTYNTQCIVDILWLLCLRNYQNATLSYPVRVRYGAYFARLGPGHYSLSQACCVEYRVILNCDISCVGCTICF